MNGYLAGDCAIKLSKHDTRLVEVGITVQKEHHIKGIAKEAISLLLDYMFEILSVHKSMAVLDVRSNASRALLEFLGFSCE